MALCQKSGMTIILTSYQIFKTYLSNWIVTLQYASYLMFNTSLCLSFLSSNNKHVLASHPKTIGLLYNYTVHVSKLTLHNILTSENFKRSFRLLTMNDVTCCQGSNSFSCAEQAKRCI